jgi:hypothetical protein
MPDDPQRPIIRIATGGEAKLRRFVFARQILDRDRVAFVCARAP